MKIGTIAAIENMLISIPNDELLYFSAKKSEIDLTLLSLAYFQIIG
ncbi:hypothetical protein YPPY59_3492, partial [Yersinia pestis PY-59]